NRLKRRNEYGPVLFVFDVEALLCGSVLEVRVTKSNPSEWSISGKDADHWYMTVEVLKSDFYPKDSWNKSVVLSCTDGRLPCAAQLKKVVLDDRKEALPDREWMAFELARERLRIALAQGLETRVCPPPYCSCGHEYSKLAPQEFHKMFNPDGMRPSA